MRQQTPHNHCAPLPPSNASGSSFTHVSRVALPPCLPILSSLLSWCQQLELGQVCQARQQPLPGLGPQHGLNLARLEVTDAGRLLAVSEQLQQVGDLVAAACNLQGSSSRSREGDGRR
jgi:hypothetical protein